MMGSCNKATDSKKTTKNENNQKSSLYKAKKKHVCLEGLYKLHSRGILCS